MALSHVMNIISNAGAVSAGTGSGGGGGGGSSLDTQTVTVGVQTLGTGGSGLPSGTTSKVGFPNAGGTPGSISDGTSNLYSGAAILGLYYTWDTYYPVSGATLIISGASRANSGWTTMTIGTTAYQRTSASYTANSGGNTYWSWYIGSDTSGSQNPFSGTGTNTTVTFT